MSLFSIVNPAGGIYYHIQALKNKKKLWDSFVEDVHDFLSRWNPKQKQLIIFGGSGGYCLKTEFLDKFEEIILVDPDPISGFIFKKNHTPKKLRRVSCNYLKTGLLGLEQLTLDFPNGAFLFSNILGQLPFLIPKDTNIFETQLKEIFNKSFLGHSWATYHDTLSFHFNSPIQHVCWPIVIKSKGINETLEKWKEQNQIRHIPVEVVDHFTDKVFFPRANQLKTLWRRTPKSYHIIEGFFQN
jgi:hypothetical protein